MSTAISVRIPQAADVAYAVRLFYEKTELSTTDVINLFGGISRGRAGKLKELVREVMHERNTINYNPLYVNTEVAYEVWGIDIDKLERRYAKLQKYGAIPKEATT